MNHSALALRPLNHADLPEIVRVHRAAFPSFFLTRMGSRFLEAYYGEALHNEATIALGAFTDATGTLAGFVIGYSRPTGFYRSLLRHWYQWLPRIIVGIAKEPSLLRNVIMNSARVTKLSRTSTPGVELASLAVDGKGRGVGGALVAHFVATQSARNAGRVFLTTDAHNNDAVRRFYERHSFVAIGTEFRGNRELIVYQRSLP